jgi:predicted ribonuclease YlaK
MLVPEMHKSATKCNEKVGKWCKNKHGASKIIDTLETYHSLANIIVSQVIFSMLVYKNISMSSLTYIIGTSNEV